jgi:RNA polymerase sigma-70 factor (family 1)
LEHLPTIAESIIYRLKDGDEAAFEAVYTAYAGYLRLFTASILKDTDIAEEVVQEVMTKVWLLRDHIDTDKNFGHWLRTIARNATFDQLKRIARQRELQQQVWQALQQQQSTDTDADLVYKDYNRLYKEAVDALPRRQYEVFTLSRMREMSHEEIACELGISTNTVRNHMVSALGYIRRYLKIHLVWCIYFLLH